MPYGGGEESRLSPKFGVCRDRTPWNLERSRGQGGFRIPPPLLLCSSPLDLCPYVQLSFSIKLF